METTILILALAVVIVSEIHVVKTLVLTKKRMELTWTCIQAMIDIMNNTFRELGRIEREVKGGTGSGRDMGNISENKKGEKNGSGKCGCDSRKNQEKISTRS